MAHISKKLCRGHGMRARDPQRSRLWTGTSEAVPQTIETMPFTVIVTVDEDGHDNGYGHEKEMQLIEYTFQIPRNLE